MDTRPYSQHRFTCHFQFVRVITDLYFVESFTRVYSASEYISLRWNEIIELDNHIVNTEFISTSTLFSSMVLPDRVEVIAR